MNMKGGGLMLGGTKTVKINSGDYYKITQVVATLDDRVRNIDSNSLEAMLRNILNLADDETVSLTDESEDVMKKILYSLFEYLGEGRNKGWEFMKELTKVEKSDNDDDDDEQTKESDEKLIEYFRKKLRYNGD